MNNAVSSTKNITVRFAIRTDDNHSEPVKSQIWFEVFLYGHVTRTSQENKFPPEEYGKAFELYDKLSHEMEEKYGKEKKFVPSVVWEDYGKECCPCRNGDQ